MKNATSRETKIANQVTVIRGIEPAILVSAPPKIANQVTVIRGIE